MSSLRLLAVIEDAVARDGAMPTQVDMAKTLGVSVKVVRYRLETLAINGYLVRNTEKTIKGTFRCTYTLPVRRRVLESTT